MSDLTLSTVLCGACGEPMVEQWLAYWAGPRAPQHANCGQYAKAVTDNPTRFGLPTAETRDCK